MDFFDVNLAKAIGGGGGGSSFFGTANVTVAPIIEGSPAIIIYETFFNNLGDPYYLSTVDSNQATQKLSMPSNGDIYITGMNVFDDNNNMYMVDLSTIQLDGSAEIDPDNGVKVFGDCTITAEFILD